MVMIKDSRKILLSDKEFLTTLEDLKIPIQFTVYEASIEGKFMLGYWIDNSILTTKNINDVLSLLHKAEIIQLSFYINGNTHWSYDGVLLNRNHMADDFKNYISGLSEDKIKEIVRYCARYLQVKENRLFRHLLRHYHLLLDFEKSIL